MRDQPFRVDGVAGEAAADMIIDAALTDSAQGAEHRLPVTLVAVPKIGAPQHVEHDRIGELRCALEATALHVPDREDGLRGAVEEAGIGHSRGELEWAVQVL